MLLKVANTDKCVNWLRNIGTCPLNQLFSQKIFSVLIFKWEMLKTVPQNEPVVGILLLSLDIMTNALPSLNVTYYDDLTFEGSPNPGPVHDFLVVTLLTANKEVGTL